MLEFQEGFFDQEIRDGFYLDTTMKTVWAAEMEVLQKVAEICDRHGLKWYAAYGTLLGAIRHEGFIPWDDDMDIWVKRSDYNKLMKILPKELPEGYRVRSPLTEEGYDQYHTCINSGSGISIAKEWLEQFHGCPFTVGLDIFPLDYLPRDEKERELQKKLFSMIGRMAQLAKNIGRGDYDLLDNEADLQEKEEKTKQREECIEEVRLGIEYLENTCKLQLDHYLLETEKWNELSSCLWAWANYIAMMYGEEESDYIVEYLDYIQYEYKVYPKEWFADGYCATYENFMVPIPAGYDCLLRYIYGDYFVRRKKTGMHEYPYYARQLRQLREYVKNVEQRVIDAGLVSIDDIEVREKITDIPDEWVSLTQKDNGERKKIVLSANDSVLYEKCGEKALKKLEETFEKFEKVKESVLLWWRPQPIMRQRLERVSPELGMRYQKVLEKYRQAGWGICDETENVDCAVEACDVYYGDMNPILQPFQDAEKPIMIAKVDSAGYDGNAYNEERLNEFRAFFSFSDYVEDDEKLYFANNNFNAFVIVNKGTWQIEHLIPFEDTELSTSNIHLRCIKKQNKICFLPAGIPYIHIYDIKNRTQHICKFLDKSEGGMMQESWDYFICGNQVFLLPSNGNQGLWKWVDSEDAVECEDWWAMSSVEGPLQHGSMSGNNFFTLAIESNQLFITNVVSHTVHKFYLPDKQVQNITYDGRNFWYTMEKSSDIVCWNTEQGIVDRYQIPPDIRWENGVMAYLGICYAQSNLFLFSKYDQSLYILDKEKCELVHIYSVECSQGAFFAREVKPSFRCKGNQLICLLKNAGDVVLVDLDTLEVAQYNEGFQMDKQIRDYLYQLLIDKNVLLLENPGVVDLDMLLQHCMG